MQWWRKVERWGKEYPVLLALCSLALGFALGIGGFYGAFNAGWLAGTSKPVADLGRRMADEAVQALVDQKCGQEINKARIDGFNAAKNQVCKVETFLQLYTDKIADLGRRAQKLRDNPNPSDQQVLNYEIEATIQEGERTRSSLREIADAFDGEAAAVRDLVLKHGSAADINARMIALANAFPAKKELVDAALQAITPKLP
jgi:hypothetical protein